MKIAVNNINPNKLHDELMNKDITPVLVQHDKKEGECIAENTWITFEQSTDMDSVQQIIDAHDPTPILQPPTVEERLRMLEDTILFLLGGM